MREDTYTCNKCNKVVDYSPPYGEPFPDTLPCDCEEKGILERDPVTPM